MTSLIFAVCRKHTLISVFSVAFLFEMNQYFTHVNVENDMYARMVICRYVFKLLHVVVNVMMNTHSCIGLY
jgi:hypothetical protein